MNTALTELHLHLDGSLNLPWAYKTALKRNVISEDTSFEDFYQILCGREYKTLQEAFLKFDITCDCMQTKEDLHDSAYYLVKDLADQGLIYAEIRFASQQHCKKGLSQEEAVAAVLSGLEDGMKDYPGILCKLINCLMHKGDSAMINDEENRETIRVTKKFLGKGVVALDLAGYENNCPFEDYAYLFEIAREEGIPYTIHAAEMGIGAHIIDALNMKPSRIGHGFQCTQNDEWLQKVVDEQIPLEVCVTSNTTSNPISHAQHPIRKMFEAGVKITLSSDNIIFSNTDAENEHRILKRLGVSEEELIKTTYNSIDAAFCTSEEKEMLRKKADKYYNKK